MTRIVVPVRFPLGNASSGTLTYARKLADERDAELTVLHINVYHHNRHVTREELKREVEAHVGSIPNARFVVRSGFLVEECILEEAAAENADVVVIGRRVSSRLRRTLDRLRSNPQVDAYLRTHLDCEVVTA